MIEERYAVALAYVAIGAVYGVGGYVDSVLEGDKEFKVEKFGRTLAIGAVAGGLVALQGDELSPGALEAMMAAAVPAFDQIVGGYLDR